MKKTIEEVRDYLLENRVDTYGDLDLYGLDFSEFDGEIVMNGMKVKGNLSQSYHEVKGDLDQIMHKVQGDLSQSSHNVRGDLYHSNHDVRGDYYSTNINVTGTITFDVPKKALKEITAEELEKMGYKIKEELK